MNSDGGVRRASLEGAHFCLQGKEADVVLFSCVRAHDGVTGGGGGRGVGFLADVRRMNVGLTRARLAFLLTLTHFTADVMTIEYHFADQRCVAVDAFECYACADGHVDLKPAWHCFVLGHKTLTTWRWLVTDSQASGNAQLTMFPRDSCHCCEVVLLQRQRLLLFCIVIDLRQHGVRYQLKEDHTCLLPVCWLSELSASSKATLRHVISLQVLREVSVCLHVLCVSHVLEPDRT